MTPEQFCYWLQGRAEMQPNNPPSADEWRMIADHLQTVFKKVTPAIKTESLPDYLKRAQEQRQPMPSQMWGVPSVPNYTLTGMPQFGRTQPAIC
jgi:hypothetical protein